MLTIIPFSGFYNSLHDAQINDALRMSFADRATGCETNEGLLNRFYDRADFGIVYEKYARAYAGAFADKFHIELEFDSLSSPREYNFKTDRIFCTIDESEVRRILSLTPIGTLRTVAEEWFKSRSGFISFYSPDIADWGDVSEWDHNQIGALISAYVKHSSNDEFDGYAEVDLMEKVSCNGYLENWLYECNPDAARLYRIRDYLQDRAER